MDSSIIIRFESMTVVFHAVFLLAQIGVSVYLSILFKAYREENKSRQQPHIYRSPL